MQAARCICQYLCANDVLLILDDVWPEELRQLSFSVLCNLSTSSSRWLITSRNAKQVHFNPEPVTLVLHNDNSVLQELLQHFIQAPPEFWVRSTAFSRLMGLNRANLDWRTMVSCPGARAYSR